MFTAQVGGVDSVGMEVSVECIGLGGILCAWFSMEGRE